MGRVLTDNNFLGAFFQTIILILLGYIFRKKNIVNDTGKSAITTVIWKLGVPCMAFNAFMADINYKTFISSITVLVLTFLFFILFIVAGLLFFKKNGSNKAKVCALSFAIGQVTLFSMPILKSIYAGHEGLVMISIDVMTIPFRIILYIVAFFMVSNLKLDKENISNSLKKIMINPIMIGMFGGMLIWALQNFMPQINISGESYAFLRIDKTLPALYAVVPALEKLVSPLAMFLIGLSLGEADILSIFKGKTVWVVSVLRTLIAPLFVLITIILFNNSGILTISHDAAIALVIGFSAPVSVSFNLFCIQYHCEEHLSSSICLLSTVLCIVTIPLMYTLTMTLV